jgi:hypothetical protein
VPKSPNGERRSAHIIKAAVMNPGAPPSRRDAGKILRQGAVLCAASLFGVLAIPSGAAASATDIRPAMRTVVTCVYDMVRSHAGILSVEVYAVGNEKYEVEYKFRDKGRILRGGIGIWDDIMPNGKHSYSNDFPRGQSDDSGSVEMEFLGQKMIGDMHKKCHLIPGFDNTFVAPGSSPPPWRKIDMSGVAN